MNRFETVTIGLALCGVLLLSAGCPSESNETTTPLGATSDADATPVIGLDGFTAVDTSRLNALPHPYVLEDAFPQLNFGNQRPLQLLSAPDESDRVFVLCQEGKVHVFQNLRDADATEVFLDLSENVSRTGNEEGLLGLAFHPEFTSNREVYVCYSAEGPQSVVSRLRVSPDDPGHVDPETEEILLVVPQPFRTQNGGSIEFGPDGYLYVGLGDGGSANDPLQHGQNLESLLGSVLRIDVDTVDPGLNYAIPADNPFVDGGEDVRGEIWAYGFRNVWRLAFDRETGKLWVGDVGQDRFEEVNVVIRGGNYGWNLREGEFPLDETSLEPLSSTDRDAEVDCVPPLASYYHSEGRAVVGGRVYHGDRLAGLDGAYLYADFFSGNIWAAHHQDQALTEEKICSAKVQISGFGEDRNGEVYLCAFDGNIYRLRENADFLMGESIRFPSQLSETGLFESTAELRPVAGMIPYSVNVPLWSDQAVKERYIALPVAGQVEFSETGQWLLPEGTVVVKTFFLDMTRDDPSTRKRLETRLLVHSPDGWEGYTYIWTEDQTDAHLIDAATTVSFPVETPEGEVTRRWYFPSRSDCKACHTDAATFVLSINTRQLNRDHDYPHARANQITALDSIGIFSNPVATEPAELEAYPDWTRDVADLDQQVRAYLDVNCAFCHMPGGVGNSPIDLRYHTPLDQTALVGSVPRGTRARGETASFIVSPGRPQDSELLLRMQMRGPGQMPILATFVVDEQANSRVARWIEQVHPARY